MQNVQKVQANHIATDDGQPSDVARMTHGSGPLQPESSTHLEQTPPPAKTFLQCLAAIGNSLIGRRPPSAQELRRSSQQQQQQQQQQQDTNGSDRSELKSHAIQI
jgi:hypothetical protein